jgi:hypothetical protein
MLRDLVTFFASIGVTDQTSLRRWATDASFDDDFKGRVRGLGPAVFQWLVMRQGVDTVKPDVHVHRFAARVLGRSLSDTDVVEVIVAAARRLGRPAHRLDWAIWEAGRNGLHAGTALAVDPPERAGTDALAVPLITPDEAAGGEPVAFLDDDAGYLAWIAVHPDGYVLNSHRQPTPRYLVLHRATCHTMAPRSEADTRAWTAAYRKTCSATAGELVNWAQAYGGGPPTRCRTCRPLG